MCTVSLRLEIMKINRSYSLDEDNVRALKTVDNASMLIDTLLRRYFKEQSGQARQHGDDHAHEQKTAHEAEVFARRQGVG